MIVRNKNKLNGKWRVDGTRISVETIVYCEELIGKEVKVEYGTRVGLYSTGRCSSAPIEKIEEINKKW